MPTITSKPAKVTGDGPNLLQDNETYVINLRSGPPEFETVLSGGLFRGRLVTAVPVPDGTVLKLSIQHDRVGNGPQRIQSAVYRIGGGKGVAL